MLGKLEKILPQVRWKEYEHLWKRLETPARTVLLKEGDISRKAYLIDRGCMRMWFNHNGRDVTFQFFFESEAVSSVESFAKNQPSLFSIETIEPSVLYWIYKKDFDKLVTDHPALKEMLFVAVQQRQVYYMKQFLSFLKDKPKERYIKLLKERPHIVQRVPQHYIASYLGITSVSLSRIRNKL